MTRLRIVPASIELLDAWMDAEGWPSYSVARAWFRRSGESRVVLAAVRGHDVLGVAGFVVLVPGTSVVIVHPEHRERGIGTKLLRRLAGFYGLAKAHACTPGGARLCKKVGVPYKRVTG